MRDHWGRDFAKGHRVSGSKLTEKKVRRMRALAAEGQTYASLARKFKVSPCSVSSICRRKTWAHLT